MTLDTRLTVTDLFCGAGGSSLGAHHAGAEVYLAINHWQLAVETHSSNFPDTLHDCADVSAESPRRYPSTTVLMASPECTNHTGASGRKRPQAQMDLFKQREIDPSAERSRATMWDVPRFAEHHNYELVIVENVIEARKWAPFDAWLHAMDSLGYDHKVCYLNAMFFHPAPQSRDRMYVVFWRKGNQAPALDYRPDAYCGKCERDTEAVQSWSNPHKPWGMWGRYRSQYVYRCPQCADEVTPYYYAAANVIDWSDLGERIGDRDRPLRPKTVKRIKKGLEIYGNQSLLVQLAYGHAQNNRSTPLTDALPTQSTRQSVALLSTPFFLGYANGNGPAHPITDALLTQFGSNAHALVSVPPFMMDTVHTPRNDRQQDMVWDLTGPNRTQIGNNVHALISPPFIVELRNHVDARAMSDPLSTVVAGGNHHALINPAPFLASYYGSGGQMRGLDEAVATITAVDRHALVTPSEPPAVEDCRFRMLQPNEIGRAMAFPEDYRVQGNKRDQVKQYGNAVVPVVMKWLFSQSVRTLM